MTPREHQVLEVVNLVNTGAHEVQVIELHDSRAHWVLEVVNLEKTRVIELYSVN